MLNFFKRKCSNSFEINVGLPTTNVVIPIPENVDAPILENVDAPILENVHFPIPENVDVSISQTQFQRVDLDSLDYDPGTRKQIWEYCFTTKQFAKNRLQLKATVFIVRYLAFQAIAFRG